MAQVQVTGCIFMERSYRYDTDFSRVYKWTPIIRDWKSANREDLIYIGEQTFMVEAPDDFDPTADQVAVIEAQKLAALVEYQKKVADCTERLSKLLAIEHTESAL